MQRTDMEKFMLDIDAVTNEFIKYFANLSTEQLNYKKEPAQWSIAQNINHIITVNESYRPVITAIRNKTYNPGWHARLGFLVNFFGRKLLDMVKPNKGGKVKTVQQWEPVKQQFIHDVVDDFTMHQQSLKQLITSSQDLIEEGTVIRSPASKLVVYKLEDAFKIMIAHEQRHLEQAKGVLAMLYAEKLGL